MNRIGLGFALAVALMACGTKSDAPASGSNALASGSSSRAPSGTPGARAFRFHIVEPSGAHDVTVSKPVIRIGRLQSAEVLMTDDSIGRSAAMIEDDARGVTYTDLGGGSIVDGVQLLGKDTLLKSGAVIEVGKSKITIEF
jgi:hypothetical protein